MRILIVGAGFAGSTYARIGAESGHKVHLIDSKTHLGGSAHDRLIEGLRVSDYGPHLFNTSNMRVVSFLSRFTEWTPYIHRGNVCLPNDVTLPFPLNLDSLESLRSIGYSADPATAKVQLTQDTTARQWLRSILSDELVELFFERYVRKMWGISLDELPASIVRRVKIRNNHETSAFPNSQFQALPKNGYAALFNHMLDHPNRLCCTNRPYGVLPLTPDGFSLQ
ncbi:hypothetical protein OAN307_c36200 [Octadecabacter antarcticus 307]|uniref:UDP-galactopyranose mutase C-terminal domain-containing protein n=1 Tax=Octadecabacter antarcticus 307 TaxID=391626 RepID=M9RGY5_9RHOB|nr:UDP-galactopyranose mutase [Octadecabacter antarcticus]AGI69090.1 hypothetical protein OAN307_c36200 [Octadecabacter antarcticus 307]